MACRAAVLGGIAALALAGCAEQEPILPGERLPVRALLDQGVAAPEAEAPGARPVTLPPAVAATDAAQAPGLPAQRTDHAALRAALAPVWSVGIGAGDSRRQRIVADPVVAGGRIFTMDSEHRLSAVSTDGTLLWQTDLVPPRDAPEQAQGGGLAVADGTLYASSGFGTLSALDAATGALRWQQELDNTATGAPSVAGDLVYVTSGDRTGWAVEAADGRVRWQIDGLADIGNVAGAPAPVVAGDRVLFAFGDGSVQAAFRQGGLRLWSATLAGRRSGVAVAGIDDVTGDPLVVGDTVYAGNHSGSMVALNVFDGDRLWTLAEGALGPAWPVGDSVAFVSDRNELIRADAATGDVIWRVDLPGYEPTRNPNRRRDAAFVNHGPVLAGGRLLVAGSDGVLRAFAPEDGRVLAETAIDGGATTRPVVAGGTLYLVTRDGDLVAYR